MQLPEKYRHANSRVRFSIRLAIFMMPIALLLAVVEFRLRLMPTMYERKHNALMQAADSLQILALGSSHGLMGFQPAAFSVPAFNLANISQTWPLDYALLKRYAPHLPRLRWVVVSASYFSPWVNLAEADPKRLHFYKRFHDISSPEGDAFTFANVCYTGMYGPRLGLRLALQPGLNEGIGLHQDGWQEQEPEADVTTFNEKAIQRMQEHLSAMHKRHFYLNMAALDSIATYCKTNGLQLMVVHYPTHSSYTAQEKPEWKQELDKQLQNLSVSKDLRFWDAHHELSLPDSAFADPDHLSRYGAKVVSSRLDDIITQLSE